jgi:hypothetical protein
MTLIAHAVIEVPVDAEDPTQGVTRYERGDAVPEDLDGIEELIDAGSVSEEEYDPAEDAAPPLQEVVIDGIRYVRQEDSDA